MILTKSPPYNPVNYRRFICSGTRLNFLVKPAEDVPVSERKFPRLWQDGQASSWLFY